jgi:hypothetical protein
MKRQAVFVSALLVCSVVALLFCEIGFDKEFSPNQHYIWGISNTNLTIPDGSIITALLIIVNHLLTNTYKNAKRTADPKVICRVFTTHIFREQK